ncbi:MAG: hypothetical protein JWQ27_2906 [Ferruginibacter sp.]|nr:hypothetical protein [Ferruginibacter sp.]
MQKTIVLFFITILSLGLSKKSEAQVTVPGKFKTYNVGIFAPLFLDSLFNDAGNYRFGKSFPKFALQAIDFVQGAQIALDSMPVYNGNIHATVYDSRSYNMPISRLIAAKRLDSLDLIIGSVKDADFTQLAALAQQKNIPFISATYPNDAGITANPFLVIVNSTLKAHCESIFSYLLQSHGQDKIFLVRKPGAQEDKVAEYFRNINAPDGKPLLNIQTVNINGDFSVLTSKLDSTKKNIFIGGSLSEDFATKLANEAFSWNKIYPITLIGMPNWDGFSFMNRRSEFKDFPVYYTTPYYNNKWDSYSRLVQSVYKKKYKGVPSDMSYKGFEAVFLFARLLTRYPDDYMSHLNDFTYKVFNEYNFKPVFLQKNMTVPDYFENKHLYFIRAMNGTFSKAW